jgi:hypothetical protein
MEQKKQKTKDPIMADIVATKLGAIQFGSTVYKASEVDSLLSALDTKFAGLISSAVNWKGTVASFEDLPAGAAKGDMYNVGADLSGDNYVWNGEAWDKLASTFVLPDYLSNASLEAKYLQIANVDTKVAELGYLKAAGVDAMGVVKTVTVNGTAVAVSNNTLALTDVASAAALSTLDGAAVKGIKLNGAVQAFGEGNIVDLGNIATSEALGQVGERLEALEGLVDADKVAAWTGKQDALTAEQLLAVNSGVTATWKGSVDAAIAAAATEADLTLAEGRISALEALVDADKVAVWDAKQGALSEAQLAACDSGVTAAWKASNDAAVAAAATEADLTLAEGRIDTLEGWKPGVDQDITDLKAASATHAAAADLTALKSRVDALAAVSKITDADAASSTDLVAKINALIDAVAAVAG